MAADPLKPRPSFSPLMLMFQAGNRCCAHGLEEWWQTQDVGQDEVKIHVKSSNSDDHMFYKHTEGIYYVQMVTERH
jgi:hypothetical protein